jgi:hypothetical protein
VSYQNVQLLGYAPDVDPGMPGVFESCFGYEPTQRGWRLQRAVTSLAVTDTGDYHGGEVTHDVNETEYVHFAAIQAGGAWHLYAWDGTALGDVTGGAYSTSSTDWSFAQFGNYILAANRYDPIQFRDVTTSSLFAALGHNSPKAKIVVTWGPPTATRIMVLGYDNGSGFLADGWWSCAIGGPTQDWTPDVATESQNDRLEGEGAFTCGVAFGDDLIAFSRHKMWRASLELVDSDNIVSWKRIADDVGCVGMHAARVVGGVLYFVSGKGLYEFDGSYPRLVNVPIQQHIAFALSGRASFSATPQDTTLHSDATGQRLLLSFRAGSVVTQSLSINLLNHKIGMLALLPDLPVGFLDDGYRVTDNGVFLTLYREAATAIANANFYAIFFTPLGDNTQATALGRAYPRFATAPSSITIRSSSVLSPDAGRIYAGSTASASPWAVQLIGSDKWHALSIHMNNTSSDPELTGLQVEMIPDGIEP